MWKLVLLCAGLAAADWNPTLIADTYINLGGMNHDPTTVNCTAYAYLFTSDGILHSPGIPDAMGYQSIEQACQQSHSEVDPLISFQILNIPVVSWNTEKRLAFSWVINGVRTSDGKDVYAPAITAMFMNTQAQIEEAWSFYDDSQIQGRAPPFNGSLIAKLYTHLGSMGFSKQIGNCTAWADLFTDDGICNEPGVPPSKGTADLVALCERRVARWSTFLPSVQLEIPVMSWNTEKRLAFQWTITGQAVDGKAYVVPAITVLFMHADGSVYQSWDWWDDRALPPPPPL